MQVDLYNGRETVVVVALLYYYCYLCSDSLSALLYSVASQYVS